MLSVFEIVISFCISSEPFPTLHRHLASHPRSDEKWPYLPGSRRDGDGFPCAMLFGLRLAKGLLLLMVVWPFLDCTFVKVHDREDHLEIPPDEISIFNAKA